MIKNILIFFISSISLLAAEFKERELISDLSYPWDMVWAPDNTIWFTERPGRINKINPITGQFKLLLTISDVYPNNEGGLLGMVFHPDFESKPFLYVVYNYKGPNNTTLEKIVRYKVDADIISSPLIILDKIPGASIHNGSRLLFGPDQKLYISTGDASNQSSAQSLSSLSGKILRLNDDGSIPEDNPFAGSPIWTYGHRNPQGLTFVDDLLFSSEHGPSTDDEINIIEKGRNYGWPNVAGYCDNNKPNESQFCSENNVKEPIISLEPTQTLALCGMDYYNHTNIPEFNGSLLVATLKMQRLLQLKLNDTKDKIVERKEFLINKYGRLRDVLVAPNGNIYLCTSNGNDRIIELSGINTSIDPNKDNEIRLFPNPAKDIINISGQFDNISIFNLLGEEVSTIDNNSNYWNTNDKFGYSLADGIYIAKVKTKMDIKNIIVILQR